MTEDESLRVVALADTDSYVKWAAALVAALPDGELIVLDTPLVVSDTQLDAALKGSGLSPDRVRRASYAELPGLLTGADAVLLAARGPLVRVLARLVAGLEPRPVIVTGLPGISVPATWLALHFRRQCDVFLLHSHREVREFAALAEERGIRQRFAMATLPFAQPIDAAPAVSGRGTDLVFAAQALVPRDREDRERIVRLLIRAAEADPAKRVVLKLRGRPGEAETHRELHAYPELLAEAGSIPENLVVSTEAMSQALEKAEGLVTVSSTAAIEAAAAGVPVIALDTFGVTERLINVVFLGSGLLGGEDDVIARRFHMLREDWLHDNYFHDPGENDWQQRIRSLVSRRRQGVLAPQTAYARAGGRVRDAWERRLALGNHDPSRAGAVAYAVGVPLRAVLRRVRAFRSRRLSA